MSTFRDYLLNVKQVTSMCLDTTGGNYLWIAFAQSGGNCTLKKVAANDLTQVYFTITVPVTAINDMKIIGGFLALAVDSSTEFLYFYSLSNPITSFSSISKADCAVTEHCVALTANDDNLYALTPGVMSGTNAQIVSLDDDHLYVETIDVTGCYNATSITIDTDDDLWIVTYELPANLFRVYFSGSWIIEQTPLI